MDVGYRGYTMASFKSLLKMTCALGQPGMLTVAHNSHCKGFLKSIAKVYGRLTARPYIKSLSMAEC